MRYAFFCRLPPCRHPAGCSGRQVGKSCAGAQSREQKANTGLPRQCAANPGRTTLGGNCENGGIGAENSQFSVRDYADQTASPRAPCASTGLPLVAKEAACCLPRMADSARRPRRAVLRRPRRKAIGHPALPEETPVREPLRNKQSCVSRRLISHLDASGHSGILSQFELERARYAESWKHGASRPADERSGSALALARTRTRTGRPERPAFPCASGRPRFGCGRASRVRGGLQSAAPGFQVRRDRSLTVVFAGMGGVASGNGRQSPSS